MFKAIIFDFDGIIVDSEPLHFKTHRLVLEKHGIFISEEDYKKYGVSHGSDSFYSEMAKKYNKKINFQETKKERRKLFVDSIDSELKLRDDFDVLIESLHGKYKIGIASATKTGIIKQILEKFNLTKYFDEIVGGDEIKKNKPFPDIYLEAARRLDIPVEECIAIEDSESGLTAAKAAGMKCIAVPNDFTVHQDFSKADKIIDSLKDFDPVNF
ncbi:HAD family phosphatase [Candidatus Woesearchaeota archaeon]|nr:HAD family phosphatase [Candidatus Woesearchaeota archaeon]